MRLKIVKFLKKNKEFTLFVILPYPAPASDINLRYIERLKKFITKLDIQVMKEVRPFLWQRALGASIIERHLL